MIKFVENKLEVYAALLTAFSAYFAIMAKLAKTAIPAMRVLSINLQDEKYDHIKYRVDGIRDLAIRLVSEIVSTATECKKMAAANPEDFKEVHAFVKECESVSPEVEKVFAEVVSKTVVSARADADAAKSIQAWFTESPDYGTLISAVQEVEEDNIETISFNMYLSSVDALFHKNVLLTMSPTQATDGEYIHARSKEFREELDVERSLNNNVVKLDGVLYRVLAD